MGLQKSVRWKACGGRCIFASASFPEMMASFSEREMVMIVYERNTLFSETS